MADYISRANAWLTGDFDPETKGKIIELRNSDPAAFEDAFYKNLEFGTGGLRGIMGVGTNRMNKYTVGMATQGLANYILAHCKQDDLRFCISYDSRNNSKEFAKITADVMSANGIDVFIFDNIRPTPELSYAIRLKGAIAGVMITASHNPKEYNGYKVFWSDGGQITSPVDKDIVAEVNKITDPSMVKFTAGEACWIRWTAPTISGISTNALAFLWPGTRPGSRPCLYINTMWHRRRMKRRRLLEQALILIPERLWIIQIVSNFRLYLRGIRSVSM